MTETTTAVKDWQEEILKTVRNGQEAVLEALKTWSATAQSITPKLPNVNLPLAGMLPSPQEVVATAYDFAEQLLASQRRFAEEMVKVTAPLTARDNGEAAAE